MAFSIHQITFSNHFLKSLGRVRVVFGSCLGEITFSDHFLKSLSQITFSNQFRKSSILLKSLSQNIKSRTSIHFFGALQRRTMISVRLQIRKDDTGLLNGVVPHSDNHTCDLVVTSSKATTGGGRTSSMCFLLKSIEFFRCKSSFDGVRNKLTGSCMNIRNSARTRCAGKQALFFIF